VNVSGGSPTSTTITGLTNGTSYTFTVAATNSVGTGVASAPSTAVTPQDTIFDFGTPTTADSGDKNAVTVGVKFTADVAGQATGVRFYKAAANTGTHVGALWDLKGQGHQMASATFTGETATGWQSVTFSRPVSLVPGTTYVASYYAPNGHYSVTANGFGSAVDHAPLHALGNGTSANGVFVYANAFPTGSYNASNYWVDVMFAPNTSATTPSAPGNVSATPATGSAQVSWTAPASDGGTPITGYTITPYVGSTAQATVNVADGSATSAVVTGLTNGTAYTFTVTAKNGVGSGPASAQSAAVTPQSTIFGFGAPATIDAGDSSSVTLGVKFISDVSGHVTGIRFYKASANTGSHVGSLWDATGNLLATATFTGETGSGWQYVAFSQPVAITAGTIFIASYYAPGGHYSLNSGGFNAAVDSPPLHAVATATSPNGVFAYGVSSVFPTGSYNASNYWVDLTFTTP
jgi:hypothetical protein